jgi:pyrroloquinoline quinone (PQQ) biosynthesis protein C
MTPFDRLWSGTERNRMAFVGIPIIGRALRGEVPQWLYLEYLGEAYHHVRHTCPLLRRAAERTDDQRYRSALFEYIEEEEGHDQWILEDIAALGGDPSAAMRRGPGYACKAMVEQAYHCIDNVSPYALLGMVHVLEGMSVQLAGHAVTALRKSFGLHAAQGLKYLTTHGDLDTKHTAFFRDLVDGFENPAAEQAIIDTANTMYRLFGDIFRELDVRQKEREHVA